MSVSQPTHLMVCDGVCDNEQPGLLKGLLDRIGEDARRMSASVALAANQL